jgi:hypothetical protein
MKYCIALFLTSFLLISNCFAQYTNFVIHPSNNSQLEPIITKHPTNPQILFASSYTYSGIIGEGVYVTTDGGLSWSGSDTLGQGSSIFNHAGDPGPVIDKNGVFIMTHLGNSPPGMLSNFSTDMGATWSNNILVAGNNQE